MSDHEDPITDLLNRAGRGDEHASNQVVARIYGRLRQLAAAQRARLRPGDTLDTTALVHETYMRLAGRDGLSWNGRQHFYCTAARTMRDLLVEEARRKGALKRGGDQQRIELGDVEQRISMEPADVIALDSALRKLELEHPDKLQMVMLRYFTGLTVSEIAEVMAVSLSTVERHWRFCRAWLSRELTDR